MRSTTTFYMGSGSQEALDLPRDQVILNNVPESGREPLVGEIGKYTYPLATELGKSTDPLAAEARNLTDPLAAEVGKSGEVEGKLSDQDEDQKKLRREQLKQDLYLVFAILLIVTLTSLIVALKILFLTEPVDPERATFLPLGQDKNSKIKYTGNGFLPCKGNLPCQVDYLPLHLNAERKEGEMAEWNGIDG